MAARSESNRGGGCAVSLFNILAVMFVVATFVVVVIAIFLIATPDNFLSDALRLNVASNPEPTRLSIAAVPTITASRTVGVILPPTSTPHPSQDTATVSPLNTLRPTLTPSITPTFPPAPPTPNPTPLFARLTLPN